MYIETAGGKSHARYPVPCSATQFTLILAGVHSPTLSASTQADAYRPLLLPTILVADSRLGGISSTLSAFESLTLRGYTVDAVLLFREEYYRNWEYLEQWFGRKGIRVGTVDAPPQKHKDVEKDADSMEQYYRVLCDQKEEVSRIVEDLQRSHERRLDTLDSMPRRTLDTVWWPFTQHGQVKEKDVMVIDSASGDYFSTYGNPAPESPTGIPPSLLQPTFDGSASWWTQTFGHAHPELTLAAAHAAGRYGHVIFPMATHEPALALAERLVKQGPGKGWAQRAFISDNGSTGMEVALKMAMKATAVGYPQKDGGKKELKVLGITGGYHGDTIGAMDACDGGIFNTAVEWYRGRGYWFDPPSVGIRDGRVKVVVSGVDWKSSQSSAGGLTFSRDTSSWETEFKEVADVYDVESRLGSPLAHFYESHIRRTIERLVASGHAFGALVIEPILLGAGGMIFVDPLFQRILVDTVRSSSELFASALHSSPPPSDSPAGPSKWRGLPIIFDEVFVGLYRLGFETSSSILGTTPDISVNAKILTGGLVPLSTTLASSSIFEAFLGEQKVDCLLHGHSYTAHPIGCAVANKTLDLIEEVTRSEEWNDVRETWGVPPAHPARADATSAQRNRIPEIWSFWDPTVLSELSKLPNVEETMALGTVLAVKIKDDNPGTSLSSVPLSLSILDSG